MWDMRKRLRPSCSPSTADLQAVLRVALLAFLLRTVAVSAGHAHNAQTHQFLEQYVCAKPCRLPPQLWRILRPTHTAPPPRVLL